jgi:hypothetical protein
MPNALVRLDENERLKRVVRDAINGIREVSAHISAVSAIPEEVCILLLAWEII